MRIKRSLINRGNSVIPSCNIGVDYSKPWAPLSLVGSGVVGLDLKMPWLSFVNIVSKVDGV